MQDFPCKSSYVTCCPASGPACLCHTLPYDLWERLVLQAQDCVPIVPGACMLGSRHLMDQAVFDGLAKLKCSPDCEATPKICLDEWSKSEVGVTAIETGSSPAADSTHRQVVAALIISIILAVTAFALLIWLICKRCQRPTADQVKAICDDSAAVALQEAEPCQTTAVTQSVTLALNKGTGKDLPSQQPLVLAPAGWNIPPSMTVALGPNLVHAAEPGSPEIQLCHQKAICFSPPSTRFSDTTTGYLTGRSSRMMAAGRPAQQAHDTDSCSLPLAAASCTDDDWSALLPVPPISGFGRASQMHGRGTAKPVTGLPGNVGCTDDRAVSSQVPSSPSSNMDDTVSSLDAR
eukprot:jgi/Ulvmu1/8914/UM005_0005.1